LEEEAKGTWSDRQDPSRDVGGMLSILLILLVVD
jgi:hypothetical protein